MATCTQVTSIDNLFELVDIPDVVGDISIIQPLLARQKDPAKMLIWMEVFKRSVIKARPIQPFIKISPMLHVAQVRTPHQFEPQINFLTIPPKATVPTARALVTMISDRPLPAAPAVQPSAAKLPISAGPVQMHYALEIMDCFVADIIHDFDPVLSTFRASIAQQATETTEYIREYTVISDSCAMEENVVKTWTIAPEIMLNSVKATGVVYMPMRPNCAIKMDVFGCVEEHSVLDGPSVVNWLGRQPFRYEIFLMPHCLGRFYYVQLIGRHRSHWKYAQMNNRHPWQLKKKKSKFWMPFWSYQLNSTANSAYSLQKWAELAVLFNW